MICEWRGCGKEVTSSYPGARFCDPKCKNKYFVQKRREKLKFMSIEYKGNKCQDCQTCFPQYNVYEFHHLNPNEKDFSLSSDGHTRSWEKVKQELDKCVMLCANCHRIRHFKELEPILEQFKIIGRPGGS